MKKQLTRITALALFLAVLAPAYAAKGERKQKKSDDEAATAVLKIFDTNANGKIDGDEVTALRKAFADAKEGTLEALDKNADGKLSDEEISAITAAPAKIKKKKN